MSNPDLYTYVDIKPANSIAALEVQYRLWSARRSPDGTQRWLNWAARLRDEEIYVGWFQSTVFMDRTADIAYMVFAGHQRRGYAREASDAVVDYLVASLDVENVGVSIDPRNEASIRLAQAMGFVTAAGDPSEVRMLLDVGRRRL